MQSWRRPMLRLAQVQAASLCSHAKRTHSCASSQTRRAGCAQYGQTPRFTCGRARARLCSRSPALRQQRLELPRRARRPPARVCTLDLMIPLNPNSTPLAGPAAVAPRAAALRPMPPSARAAVVGLTIPSTRKLIFAANRLHAGRSLARHSCRSWPLNRAHARCEPFCMHAKSGCG